VENVRIADNGLGLLRFALWPPMTLLAFVMMFGSTMCLVLLDELLLWVDRSALGVDELLVEGWWDVKEFNML